MARHSVSNETISKADLTAHTELLQRMERARDELERVNTEWTRWVHGLHERYGLSKDGREGVLDDGSIVRVRPRQVSPAIILPEGDDGQRMMRDIRQARIDWAITRALADVMPDRYVAPNGNPQRKVSNP